MHPFSGGRSDRSPGRPAAAGKRSRWRKELKEWALTLGVAVAASLLIQNYAVAQTVVRNVSMQDTLVVGQRLIEDKLSYRFVEPKRGDIVIINGPESELRLVKRVVAVAGDTIEIKDGRLVLNGIPQQEPYAKGRTLPLGMELPYTVPEGHVFVMGDNREHSMDSREFGPVALSSLEGRAVFRLWPLSQFGALD